MGLSIYKAKAPFSFLVFKIRFKSRQKKALLTDQEGPLRNSFVGTLISTMIRCNDLSDLLKNHISKEIPCLFLYSS